MKPGYLLPAAELAAGTVITTTAQTTLVSRGKTTVLTKTDRPGRCPWRIGGPRSRRFAANWRAQELINEGAKVAEPRNRPA